MTVWLDGHVNIFILVLDLSVPDWCVHSQCRPPLGTYRRLWIVMVDTPQVDIHLVCELLKI